jgi:hypothetical protein
MENVSGRSENGKRGFLHRGATKEEGHTMLHVRNYWIYSIGLAIVWAVVLTLTLTIPGTQGAQRVLLVFGGYCIGWVSTTIARYVYPPPKRWESNQSQE